MYTLRAKAFSGPKLAARKHRAVRVLARAEVDESAILTDVRKIIAEQLGKNFDEVTAEAKFVDLDADSLDTVEIMMSLEEKFDVELDEERAEKVSTVSEAAGLITKQLHMMLHTPGKK